MTPQECPWCLSRFDPIAGRRRCQECTREERRIEAGGNRFLLRRRRRKRLARNLARQAATR